MRANKKKLLTNKKNITNDVYVSDEDNFNEYIDFFIQRTPRYIVKLKGNNNSWRTKKKPLADKPIQAHLDQRYYIGTLAKWYPSYAILDIDDRYPDDVDKIKEMLGLDAFNSMVCSSESTNSYHILLKPTFNKKPPTIRLLQNTFNSFGKENNIEIYPQANRPIRSPFGFKQECLDHEYKNLKNWWDKLHWWKRLNDFDIATIPYYQQGLDLSFMKDKLPNVYEQGKLLLQYGLQESNSRNDAQFKVLYYLWRNNIPFNEAIRTVWVWIKTKNNGFSKDIKIYPINVKKEIERQAGRIYSTYEYNYTYPDTTHNSFNGVITKKDIKSIVMISKGNLPKMKFLYQIVKWCYPRRHRTFINLHSDKLIEWSQRNYMKYLDELKKKGIIQRADKYSVDRFSKSINIKWDFKDTKDAILDDNRSPNSLEDTIKVSYKPEEIKTVLKEAGTKRKTANKIIKRIYEVSKKSKHIELI